MELTCFVPVVDGSSTRHDDGGGGRWMAWRMNDDLFERACWNILGMLAVACLYSKAPVLVRCKKPGGWVCSL